MKGRDTLENKANEVSDLVQCGECGKDIKRSEAYKSPCERYYCNKECYTLFTED